MSSTGATYPKRPSHFAHKYTRLLTKTCAAQDIGHIAFTLCVVIAHQEDAKWYRGPVLFYNEPLMALVGVTKWTSLDHARKRAVESGWLHYANEGKRRPGRYWVTIPEGLDDLPDLPCDEGLYPSNGYKGGDNDGYKGGDKGGEPSTLALNPIPSPKKETADAVAIPEGLLELIDGWNGMGPSIILSGNGAQHDPPAKAVVTGWARASKNPEQAPHLKDIPALLNAIRRAKFCHGQGWFTLPWLFAKNKSGEFNLCRLMAGAHNQTGGLQNDKRTERNAGPGARHPDDRDSLGF